MPSLKRLVAKLEDLEAEEGELRKKLRWLKKERTIEADSEAKYELDQRIQECAERYEGIDKEIEDLDEQIKRFNQADNPSLEDRENFDLLYKSILKLGYWEQHNSFEEIANKYSYGVFLIQGKSKEYGQRWLLNRLASILPNSLTTKNIVIDLNRTSTRTDIVAVWNEFACRVYLPEGSSPAQIAKSICNLWKSQNVVIAFNNVDETIKENLSDLLNDFWSSLVQIMLKIENEEHTFKLFIFFLDYQNLVSQWNVGFVENFNSDWQPIYPLGLPAINSFSDKDLRDWLNYQGDSLPEKIRDNKVETVKTLLEKQGVPMPTLRKICDLCGCNWFEQEGKWFRL